MVSFRFLPVVGLCLCLLTSSDALFGRKKKEDKKDGKDYFKLGQEMLSNTCKMMWDWWCKIDVSGEGEGGASTTLFPFKSWGYALIACVVSVLFIIIMTVSDPEALREALAMTKGKKSMMVKGLKGNDKTQRILIPSTSSHPSIFILPDAFSMSVCLSWYHHSLPRPRGYERSWGKHREGDLRNGLMPSPSSWFPPYLAMVWCQQHHDDFLLFSLV